MRELFRKPVVIFGHPFHERHFCVALLGTEKSENVHAAVWWVGLVSP